MTQKDNLKAALELARAGFYVFPCVKKTPVVRWTVESTRDEAQIRKWWKNKTGRVAAIDLAKSGHIVMDCDVKGKYKDWGCSRLALMLVYWDEDNTL